MLPYAAACCKVTPLLLHYDTAASDHGTLSCIDVVSLHEKIVAFRLKVVKEWETVFYRSIGKKLFNIIKMKM